MLKSSVLVLFFCFSSILAYIPVAMNCPDGWKWFKRSRGGWCMKVFVGSMNQENAEAKCKAEGAVLAGIQNNPEIDWVVESIKSLQNGKDGTVWIGAQRTLPCMKSGLTKECSAITSFYWSDGSAVGVQGFQWKSGEPNNMGYLNGGKQDCVHLSSITSKMDDLGCTVEDLVAGYVCGKVATFD